MFLQHFHELNLKKNGSVGGALCFPFFVPQVGCVVLSVNAWAMWRGVEALVTRGLFERAQVLVLLQTDLQ